LKIEPVLHRIARGQGHSDKELQSMTTHKLNVVTRIGTSTLQIHGTVVVGALTDLSVTSNASLSGSTATGTRVGSSANIQVSPARFTELSVRPKPFRVVVTETSNVVQSCSCEP
jgi:hypothetical protein